MSILSLLKKIDGLAIAPVSSGADRQVDILKGELPFTVHNFPSRKEHNGWVVPDKWEVQKATIKKDGKLVYDGTQHPLAVIGSSESFVGTISLEGLREHLFFKKEAPENIVYHCDLYYKPFKKLWGFSLPYRIYESLTDGEYEIKLITTHEKGQMKVLQYRHEGYSKKTIVFNAHNCHAAQLNDGPSGFSVFIEALKRLEGRKTRYSYELVIAPEHIGTIFYLASLPKRKIKNYIAGMFMEMVGHEQPIFALQESFTGKSPIDRIAKNVLATRNPQFWSAPFRRILGNDETVWEAPGIEVPMISLSRCQSKDFYYKEYHLNSDNISLMHENRLEEAVQIVADIIDVFEKNCHLKRTFDGLIALSNPKYNLYRAPGTDPSLGGGAKVGEQAKWNYLMDCLPRYFDGTMTVLDIAERHELSFGEVYEYLLKFKEKKLVRLLPL